MQTRFSLLAMAAVAFFLLTGFAPFDSDGLLRMDVTDGQGPEILDEGSVRDPITIEAQPIFHTLSSRYGGGGVLIYAEFTQEQSGFSGLFLMDLRHAGLPDLDRSLLAASDRQRMELYYQEWDSDGDIFRSDKVQGNVVVEDIFRGNSLSAVAISFQISFFDAGPDGRLGTEDDVWRQLEGSLSTSPTVNQAVNAEPGLVRSRRDASSPYEPDGDIYVSCVGETSVEERTYQEDSYAYEDDGGGCGGDTWDDDSEDPQESGGCAGEQTLDDGEPDPDSGCESSEDWEEGDEEDPFYGEDDYDDGSGCDETDDGSDDEDSSGCEGDEYEEGSGTGAGWGTGAARLASMGPRASAGGVCGAVAATMSPGRRAYLRRYLAQLDQPRRYGPLVHRFDPQTWRGLRRLMRYLPFLLLGLVIHAWRRRLRVA